MLTRWLTMPDMRPDELRDAMRWEVPQHFPNPDELTYDFTPVHDAPVNEEGQVAVLVVGAQRHLVEGYLTVGTQSRLRVQVIEPDCLATLRALEWLGLIPAGSAAPLVIIDLGQLGTRLSILRYGLPVLARTISLGTAALNKAVTLATGAEPEDAEVQVQAYGVRPGSPISDCITSWLRQLADAVTRSLEFFTIQNRGMAVEQIYLVGGGALLSGLSSFLTEYLGTALSQRVPGARPCHVQVVTLNNLDIRPAITAQVGALGPVLATALGVALREEPR